MVTSVHLFPLHLHGSWALSDVGIQPDPSARLGVRIFIQSSHSFSSDGNVHAPSSAHCASPPPLPRTSQTFASPLRSCVLIPKTVTARFTHPQDLKSSLGSFYLLLFSSLCLPSFPSLNGCQQLDPPAKFPSNAVGFPTSSPGRFWSLSSIICRIQNCYSE